MTSSSSEARAPEPPTILIVDDSEELLEFYEVLMEPTEYEVTTARSGHEALERIKKRRPDVIISDVVMPDGDGLELIAHIRGDLAPPLPPVIVCTGFDHTKEEAMRRGSALCLSKPVRPTDLRAAVRSVRLGPGDAELQETGHEWAAAARRRTSRAAAAAAAALKGMSWDDLRDGASDVARILIGYYGINGAFFALMLDEHLALTGSAGTPTLAPDEDLSERFPACIDILTTRGHPPARRSRASPRPRASRRTCWESAWSPSKTSTSVCSPVRLYSTSRTEPTSRRSRAIARSNASCSRAVTPPRSRPPGAIVRPFGHTGARKRHTARSSRRCAAAERGYVTCT